MDAKFEAALSVLRAHGISPEDADIELPDLPDIGLITDDETVYATSLDSVFDERAEAVGLSGPMLNPDDGRLHEWRERLQSVIHDGEKEDGPLFGQRVPPPPHPPEPHCAWYCPIHFFGYGWGIYIREECILDEAVRVAHYADWRAVATLGLSFWETAQRLLRAAFYEFFLHEQFHHKVESLGFRLLVASSRDRYRNYKADVYRPTFNTPQCLEESLANADSYLRLEEARYSKRLATPFRDALRTNLHASFPLQPPGYRQAVSFLTRDRFHAGTYDLQSRMLDGLVTPTTPPAHWLAAPHVIRSMMDMTEEIYVVLPKGARPLFPTTSIDPGYTVSTDEFVRALTKHHGFEVERGAGKGSHVKLSKPGSVPIVLKGNQRTLTPGNIRQALRTLGNLPLSKLSDVLDGRAP